MTIDELTRFRRELHQHPELAHNEHRTAERVTEWLSRTNPDDIDTGIGGTGVVVTYDSGREGPTLLFRCELDALPIFEQGVHTHGSTSHGISHKCGHDGHMAIIAGLAQRIAQQPLERGRVHLLFQPAEETGTGAAAVIGDAAFDKYRPDIALALHNMPGFPLHSVVVREGSITAAVLSLVIRFDGRVAHASEPEHGDNPSLAVADLLRSVDSLTIDDPHDAAFRLITPVHVRVGSVAYGISAGDAEVHYTIRSWDTEGLSTLREEIDQLARRLGLEHHLDVSVEVVEEFAATVNDSEVTRRVVEAATTLGLTVIEPDTGMRGGEDFGLFTDRFPGCLFLLGAGEAHLPIHNDGYDFPDELIATGVALFDQILRDSIASG